MIYINAKDAIRQAKKANRELADIEIKRAIARAMNRTMLNIRTKSVKEIRSQYKKTTARGIKKTMKKHNANSSDLEARLISTGGPMNLKDLKPSVNSRGVSAIVTKKRKKFPGAFQKTMKNGHTGIFARGQYVNNKLQSRRKRIRPSKENDLPIVEIKTFAIPSTIKNDIVTDTILDTAQDRFDINLAAEIKYRVLKAKGMV